MQKTMSKQTIFNELLNKAKDLQQHMNTYSFTLREFMNEDDFNELSDSLEEVTSKYETYPD